VTEVYVCPRHDTPLVDLVWIAECWMGYCAQCQSRLAARTAPAATLTVMTCPTCEGKGVVTKSKENKRTQPVRKIPEGRSEIPLERLNEQPEEIKRTDKVTIKRTRGRPQKWASDAERMRAARARRGQKTVIFPQLGGRIKVRPPEAKQ
jgi:hypothetical protein